MSEAADYMAGILIVAASLFTLSASIGLLRLPDLYTRMHAASKAGTVGSCVMLLALAIEATEWPVSARAIAGILFFLLTVSISSHLLAKAAHGAGFALAGGSLRDDLARDNPPAGAESRELPAKQIKLSDKN